MRSGERAWAKALKTRRRQDKAAFGTSVYDNIHGRDALYGTPSASLCCSPEPLAHLRSDGLGDVAERVDGGSADGLLVRLEHVQQLEADAHPLARGHVLVAAVRDAPHQVDHVLLHLRGEGEGRGGAA